jgi:2-desacetyl-2-hydroxyethyl bacteriochlorophyllide A dehydrogenase
MTTLAATAVWFTAERTVELREEPVPPPGPGQLRVEALASAISHGSEMLAYRGQIDAGLGLDLPTLAGGYGFPLKFGYASVGRVRDVGAGVAGIAPGDHVFCLHPHQSAYLAPAGLAVRLPAGVEPSCGVFAANLETALGIVHDAHPRLGEAAAVFGQGVVGLLVARLLRLAGAATVVAVEPAAGRRDRALRFGADAALAPGPALGGEIRARCGGRAPDLAVEVSGAPAALQAAIDCVADEGTVVVASWYGRKPVELDLGGRFHRGRVRLRSSQVGRLAPEAGPRWDHGRRWAAVMRLLAELPLAELISHRLPLARAAEAYRLVDERGGETGQVVLSYER